MRYLRTAGITISLCVLLCGMALQNDSIVRLSLLINTAGIALCFADRPALRATLCAAALCFLGAALTLYDTQTDAQFLTVTSALGDRIVPAGESARRTVGACLFALLTGASIGQTALEGMLSRQAFGTRAGWAGAPVRVCAFICLLFGMAACLSPLLSVYLPSSVSWRNIASLLTPLATGAVICYIASARSKAAGAFVLILYMACAVFEPALFARHAFFAVVFSILLCAKSNGREGILCLIPVPALLAFLYFYPGDIPYISPYTAPLRTAVADFAQSGGLDWLLTLYARFGIYAFAVVGFGAGALLFLLGRLLRDSFIYSAPVFFLLGWACMVLFKGLSALPTLQDAVFFAVPFGLCLIVGCMRRAPKPPPSRDRRGR